MGELVIRPADSWADLCEVFGPQGAYSGCWCMYFRVTNAEYRTLRGDGARERLRELVESPGPAPGLLAYLDETPVGWCTIAPRTAFVRLAGSRVAKPVDESEPVEGVWSVPCFYVTRAGRGRGAATALLEAAVEFARGQGARAVEGYPRDSEKKLPAAELFHGWKGLFEGAGFVEVARRTPTRPLMRLEL
ncbi:GNAT family N-acetyltransferase [Nonomuraea sp. NPDC050663]|uniref:GNAT family N-acetyltransferase n=1 Tax=Nonomuraea sp. NPDC050663 TaxID=3364370 RepID=UPI0037A63B1D